MADGLERCRAKRYTTKGNTYGHHAASLKSPIGPPQVSPRVVSSSVPAGEEEPWTECLCPPPASHGCPSWAGGGPWVAGGCARVGRDRGGLPPSPLLPCPVEGRGRARCVPIKQLRSVPAPMAGRKGMGIGLGRGSLASWSRSLADDMPLGSRRKPAGAGLRGWGWEDTRDGTEAASELPRRWEGGVGLLSGGSGARPVPAALALGGGSGVAVCRSPRGEPMMLRPSGRPFRSRSNRPALPARPGEFSTARPRHPIGNLSGLLSECATK